MVNYYRQTMQKTGGYYGYTKRSSDWLAACETLLAQNDFSIPKAVNNKRA